MTRIHDLLVREGFDGSYDAVRRYAARWRAARRKDAGEGAPAFIPMTFQPGEAYQFDWSHEAVEIAGKPIRVKVAHMRLCDSRAPSVRAYPRAGQEMLFAAPARLFALFGVVPHTGLYDHMKTALTAGFTCQEGEAYQFDWSHEDVEIAGKPMRVKVAHMRLCDSRAPYVRAYPREGQEMLFDAQARAFAFFGGVPRRGIYDNRKTAVTAVFTGKERVFNRRFLIMTDHYMVEPTACSPAAGWEKGQVEQQVQTIRGRFFQPRLRFASLAELNGWLEAECRRWAEHQDRTSTRLNSSH